MKKYRLIQGEVAGTHEGSANPVFNEKSIDFYYAEDVEQEVKRAYDTGVKQGNEKALRDLQKLITIALNKSVGGAK